MKTCTMTHEEIKNGNRLIAEFMGYTMHDHSSYVTFAKNGAHIFESTLQFERNWEWLMSVIEEIEKEGYCFMISKSRVIIDSDWEYGPYPWIERKGPTKIESAWLAVVDHIKRKL